MHSLYYPYQIHSTCHLQLLIQLNTLARSQCPRLALPLQGPAVEPKLVHILLVFHTEFHSTLYQPVELPREVPY